MSRSLRRRILIIAISLLLALAVSETVQNIFVPAPSGWISFLISLTLAVIAAALGLFLEDFFPTKKIDFLLLPKKHPLPLISKQKSCSSTASLSSAPTSMRMNWPV